MKRHRLRVSENRVQRKIFGPKREEVAGGWRRLHNEELHNLYASPMIIRAIKSRRMRWAGHIARTIYVRSTYKILVGKRETTCKTKRRCGENIQWILRDKDWEAVEWIGTSGGLL
jgi:hypothetical protein